MKKSLITLTVLGSVMFSYAASAQTQQPLHKPARQQDEKTITQNIKSNMLSFLEREKSAVDQQIKCINSANDREGIKRCVDARREAMQQGRKQDAGQNRVNLKPGQNLNNKDTSAKIESRKPAKQ